MRLHKRMKKTRKQAENQQYLWHITEEISEDYGHLTREHKALTEQVANLTRLNESQSTIILDHRERIRQMEENDRLQREAIVNQATINASFRHDADYFAELARNSQERERVLQAKLDKETETSTRLNQMVNALEDQVNGLTQRNYNQTLVIRELQSEDHGTRICTCVDSAEPCS